MTHDSIWQTADNEQELAMIIATDKQSSCCKLVKVSLPCGCPILPLEAKGWTNCYLQGDFAEAKGVVHNTHQVHRWYHVLPY